MEIREGHSVKWNDGFLLDSLEASKMAAVLPLKKVAVLSLECSVSGGRKWLLPNSGFDCRF